MILKRKPDRIIGPEGDQPYMRRWHLIPRNNWFCIYLHCVTRDDDDRALHDHPGANVSIILKGAYREILPDCSTLTSISTPHYRVADIPYKRMIRRAGAVIFRRATTPHRLEVVEGPVWSLFIMGPKRRVWGFHCPSGWRPWWAFVDPRDPNRTGPGCD